MSTVGQVPKSEPMSSIALGGLMDRVLPPLDRPTRWHVSPAIDLFGYAFSWIFLAVPLYLMLGSEVLRARDPRPHAFAFIAAAVILIDVHRHFTFPYVYLDRRLRRRFPLRFWLLPAVMVVLFTQLPSLSGSPVPLDAAGAGAIAAWTLLLLQVLRLDAAPGVDRRVILVAALSAAVASGILSGLSTALPTSWARLLPPVGASLFLSLRRPVSGGAEPSVGWSLRRALLPGCGLGILAAAALSDVQLTVGLIINLVLVVYVFWLIYHILMQKYGIFRIYAAKSGKATKVPGWVDRLFLCSWIPMIVVWTIGDDPAPILRYFDTLNRGSSRFVTPLVDFIGVHFPAMLALSLASIAASLSAFAYFEWKVNRLRNLPRLAFAGGTLLFYTSFFAIGIAGLYVAFAATHCIEYITFVWAFQRKRYPTRDPEAPILSRLVQWPILYYGGVSLVLAAVLLIGRYSTYYFAMRPSSVTILGTGLYEWVYWYAILQAFIHFYYDGFLWKMRPDFTRSL